MQLTHIKIDIYLLCRSIASLFATVICREILQISKKLLCSASKLYMVSVNSNLFSKGDGLRRKDIGHIDLFAVVPHALSRFGQTDVGRAILPQQEQRFPIWQSETEDSAATSPFPVNFSPDKSVVARFCATRE